MVLSVDDAEHEEEGSTNVRPSCSTEMASSSNPHENSGSHVRDGYVIRGLRTSFQDSTTRNSNDRELLNVNDDVTLGISRCWPPDLGQLP